MSGINFGVRTHIGVNLGITLQGEHDIYEHLLLVCCLVLILMVTNTCVEKASLDNIMIVPKLNTQVLL